MDNGQLNTTFPFDIAVCNLVLFYIACDRWNTLIWFTARIGPCKWTHSRKVSIQTDTQFQLHKNITASKQDWLKFNLQSQLFAGVFPIEANDLWSMNLKYSYSHIVYHFFCSLFEWWTMSFVLKSKWIEFYAFWRNKFYAYSHGKYSNEPVTNYR